jgi:transposase
MCAPKPRGGSRSVLEDYAERILALVAEQPDRTLDEIIAAMRKRRIPGSRSALWRFLDHHGITFKKKPAGSRAAPSGRGASAAALDPAAGLS